MPKKSELFRPVLDVNLQVINEEEKAFQEVE